MPVNQQDNRLLQRLADGDEAAFVKVYSDLNPSLLRVAQAITGSRATAEEIAQETWLSVISGSAKFKGKASFKNWVFAILTNKARTRARRDGRSRSLDLSPAAQTDDGDALAQKFLPDGSWSEAPALWDELTPERILAGREVWRIVARATDALPPVQQAILTLLEGGKMPAVEIAEILGLTEGNVRVHLHRARERIRAVLDGLLGEEEK